MSPRTLTPTRTCVVARPSAFGGNTRISHNDQPLFTVHASSGVFRGATASLHQGGSTSGQVLSRTRLDKSPFTVELENGNQVAVNASGNSIVRTFRFEVGGKAFKWQSAGREEISIYTSGASEDGRDKCNPWDWKLVADGGDPAPADEEVLAVFLHDLSKHASGQARLHWFEGSDTSEEFEILATTVVMAIEERAKKGQMMNNAADAQALAGRAQMWT